MPAFAIREQVAFFNRVLSVRLISDHCLLSQVQRDVSMFKLIMMEKLFYVDNQARVDLYCNLCIGLHFFGHMAIITLVFLFSLTLKSFILLLPFHH